METPEIQAKIIFLNGHNLLKKIEVIEQSQSDLIRIYSIYTPNMTVVALYQNSDKRVIIKYIRVVYK